ncbi:MAG: glycosyltransferase family 4 protein, partial [Deltaproteobacteria bacterium]|nr:glycosyltransferase family 4 protein [Deltaproteobacteria bacterium]
MDQRKIRVLVISHLFPTVFSPARGIFVYEQLRKLSGLCDISVVVPLFTVTTGKLKKTFSSKKLFKRERKEGIDTIYIKGFRKVVTSHVSYFLTALRIKRIFKRE